MAIKIGKDGTLYCHSIKYNWKQARNMIADGCGAIAAAYPTANPWSTKPLIYTSAGYHSGSCFKFYGTYTTLQQTLPNPVVNHLYYFGCMYECDHASGGGTVEVYSVSSSLATSKTSTWTKKSMRFRVAASSVDKIFKLSANVSGSSASVSIRVCKLMLIDLTDTFGAGNEPTKAWCEQNIREWDTYTNEITSTLWGSSKVGTNNYELKSGNPYYSAAFSGAASYNYLQLDSNWEPREYMWKVDGNTSNVEAYIYNTNNIALYTRNKYYMYAEVCNSDFMSYLIGTSFDGYFPIAEPALGTMQENCNRIVCGGGSMARWKRYSFCNSRTSFTNGSSRNTFRFDYNNNKRNYDCRITGLSLIPLAENSGYLYSYSGSNNCWVTANDINRSWCDRWIDHASSPIIHIKDHQNTSIKFNKPLFELKSSSSTSATQAVLDSYVGKTNFTLSNIINFDDWNNSFWVGDDVYNYFTVKNTTNNTTCKFVVQFVDWIDDSTAKVNMLGYGSSGSFWWSFCDGYDVQCNDIEIRPEVNKVTFNRSTGTIICKKLVLDTNATEGKVSQRLGTKSQIGYYEISSEVISVELFNPNCVEVTAHVEFYDCDDTLMGSGTLTISPNSWGDGYFILNSSGEYQQGHYIKYYFTSSDSYYTQSSTTTFSD